MMHHVCLSIECVTTAIQMKYIQLKCKHRIPQKSMMHMTGVVVRLQMTKTLENTHTHKHLHKEEGVNYEIDL